MVIEMAQERAEDALRHVVELGFIFHGSGAVCGGRGRRRLGFGRALLELECACAALALADHLGVAMDCELKESKAGVARGHDGVTEHTGCAECKSASETQCVCICEFLLTMGAAWAATAFC